MVDKERTGEGGGGCAGGGIGAEFAVGARWVGLSPRWPVGGAESGVGGG